MIQWNSPDVEITQNKENIVLKLYITPAELLQVISHNFNNEQLTQFLAELLNNSDVTITKGILDSIVREK